MPYTEKSGFFNACKDSGIKDYYDFDISIKCKNGYSYNGNTEKVGVTINGVPYIMKYQKDTDDGSEDTSLWSEYVASHFINNLGLCAHETHITSYKSNSGEIKNVVLLKDFTVGTKGLQSYGNTKQSSENTDITDKVYTFDDIAHMINCHTKISEEFKNITLVNFWNMIMLDAILGNRDRHPGNWGYIKLSDKDYKFSPIYDNGASLFPNINKVFDTYKNSKIEFILFRSGYFPACLIMRNVGTLSDPEYKRTNYKEFIHNDVSTSNCVEKLDALNRFKSIGIENIKNAITLAVDNKLIPDLYKEFYIACVCARYLSIICDESESYIKAFLKIDMKLK